jgi:hypothetical protein
MRPATIISPQRLRLERTTYHANVLPHSLEERYKVIDGGGVGEGSIVEPAADPEVVHEQWETDHHSSHTRRTAKLPPMQNIVRN